ncbi:MAG: hypothetical protein CMJ58_03445 [Planctomycetaceae bacterium]|nr:hypothetical protein [Planctomycetaceae bacterium]
MKTTQHFRTRGAQPAADSESLDELLDCWEIARERGEEISLEELCSESPELLEPLREQVNRLLEIDERLELPDAEMHSGSGYEEIDAQASYGRLKLHATGGLGAVYAAQDLRLHRPVALKFLRRKLLADRMSRGQFEMEAEITSRLEHPGVVPVYGLGETADGRSFYAMRFIQGRTLDDAISSLHAQVRQQGLDPHDRAFRALLTHYVALCKTIAYAHNRGIIHRDIKPANVMLGRYGETLVVDWGLAMPIGRTESFKHHDEVTLKPSGSSRIHSSTGIVGTPAYMSPEQLSGSTSLQPATDVYALGATLFKLLTGRIPVDGSTLSEMQQRVIRAQYARPTQLCRSVPKPLEAICLKAMAVEPQHRYATALELAEDVERYMADDAVEAYDEPAGRRMARWARRHRRAMQVAALSTLALVGMTLAFSARMASVAREQAQARMASERASHEAFGSEARAVAIALRFQIERRLDAVESAAADRGLAQAVAELAQADLQGLAALDNPQQRASFLQQHKEAGEAFSVLNDELEAQHVHWNERRGFGAASWFVILNNGRQVGRAPLHDGNGDVVDSLGRYFGYRQYYRGGGPAPRSRDFDPASPPPPIAKSFLAAPHESTNGGAFVTFTTPVFEPDAGNREHVVGVLGLAVPVSDLTNLDNMLSSSAGAQSQLTIAYMRSDYYDENETKTGLILQHDAFRPRANGPGRLAFTPLYVPAATTKRIRDGITLLDDYQDPLASEFADYDGDWLAAFAPVEGEAYQSRRDPTCAETGWCVILQRRP